MSSSADPSTVVTRLFDYDKHWASCFEPAPFLPMSREEMDMLGWDACDVIIISGDAYVDHPSFGMAIIGRLLEHHRVFYFYAGGKENVYLSSADWMERNFFRRIVC